MAKGFLALVVASIFLLVLVSSAGKISQRAPDFSYQPLVAMQLQEKAVIAAFSDALAEAAGKALAASQASGAGAEAVPAVKAAVYNAALDFESKMKEAGYGVIFWCGAPKDAALQGAPARMAAVQGAVMPDGVRLLSDPSCAESFDVNLLRGKVRATGIGFSLYSEGTGIGHAMALPDGFEGDIDG